MRQLSLFRRLSPEARVRLDRDTGCWLWTGARGGRGRYGWLRLPTINGLRGAVVTAHRYMWEKHRGPVPARHELHHVCGVRLCCNPAHLQAVPHRAHAWGRW